MKEQNGFEIFLAHLKQGHQAPRMLPRVLIVEPIHSQCESILSLISYFAQLGLGIDILLPEKQARHDDKGGKAAMADKDGQNFFAIMELARHHNPNADISFYYALDEAHYLYLAQRINKYAYEYIYFNTGFDLSLEKYAWHFCSRLKAAKASLATARDISVYQKTRHLLPEVPHSHVFAPTTYLGQKHNMPCLAPHILYGQDRDDKQNNGQNLPAENRVNLLCAGPVKHECGDYNQLIDACIVLKKLQPVSVPESSSALSITIICKKTENAYYNIFKENIVRYQLQNIITIAEDYTYPQTLALAQQALFQFFPLNSHSRFTARYMVDTMPDRYTLWQEAGLIPLMETAVASAWGLDQLSVTYENTEGLAATLLDISTHAEAWYCLQQKIVQTQKIAMENSLETLARLTLNAV